LISKIGYISAVSGGTWPTIPYIFLHDNGDDDAFLGPYLCPSEITDAKLDADAADQAFVDRLADGPVYKEALKGWVTTTHGNKSFSQAVSEAYLEDYGLGNTYGESVKRRFFTQSEETAAAIVDRNSGLNDHDLDINDFVWPRSNRPFLIVGGSFGHWYSVPFEATPLYCGLPGHHDVKKKGIVLGGGYIQPHAVDSDAPGPKRHDCGDGGDYSTVVELPSVWRHFTLTELIGLSSAAPGKTVPSAPYLRYWNPAEPKGRQGRFIYGDGGWTENYGIAPLCRRQVPKIIAVVGGKRPIYSAEFVNPDGTINGTIGNADKPMKALQRLWTGREQVPPLFKDDIGQDWRAFWAEVCAERLKGGATMVRRSHQVRTCRWWGTREYTVDILWIFNERAPAWEKKLASTATAEFGVPKNGGPKDLEKFPNFHTGEIDLSPWQARLATHLWSWIVVSNKARIGEFMDVQIQDPHPCPEDDPPTADEPAPAEDDVGDTPKE